MYKKLTVFTILLFLINNVAMASWIFSNKKYQEKIVIKAFLLDSSQICTLFNDGRVEQRNYNSLALKRVYLIIRLKNIGNSAAGGVLLCEIDGRKFPSINIPNMPTNMIDYSNFVIPLEGISFPQKSDYPEIKIKWDKLYAK